MDFFGFIGGDLATILRSIVAFLFVLTIVVFFHELGHFLAARWCGMGVRVFSVGFGPEIAGFYDRKGTRWRLSAIPLGGYVKFVGDENEASQQSSEALDRLSENLEELGLTESTHRICSEVLAQLRRKTRPFLRRVSRPGLLRRAGFLLNPFEDNRCCKHCHCNPCDACCQSIDCCDTCGCEGGDACACDGCGCDGGCCDCGGGCCDCGCAC